MCFRNTDFATEYLDLIDVKYTTELYAALRRTSVYLYTPAMYFSCCCSECGSYCCCCCYACCCSLLLFVIVCRMAMWLTASDSDSSVFFLFTSNTIYFEFTYIPLGSTVAFSVVSCFLGNYGHARSQGGRQPAAAKPPLYIRVCTSIYTRDTYFFHPSYYLRPSFFPLPSSRYSDPGSQINAYPQFVLSRSTGSTRPEP